MTPGLPSQYVVGSPVSQSVPTRPYNLVFDPVTDSIWSTNYAAGTISKVNVLTDASTDYAVGTNPIGIAFDSDTNSVWVANYGSNTSKINVSTGATNTYSVGRNPYRLAFDPVTHSVWVSNSADNTVTKLDDATGNVIGTYSVGSEPYGIAFDPITTSIWVANVNSNTVTKLDVTTGAPSAYTYNVGSQPGSVAFDPVTGSIWVANSFGQSVTKINVLTNASSTYAVGTSPSSLAFDPLTNSMWVPALSNSVLWQINVLTGATTTYATAMHPYSVAFDPVTNSMWLSTWNSSGGASSLARYPIHLPYVSSGTYESPALSGAALSGTISWSNYTATSTIAMKVRSGADASMTGATDWASCSAVTSGAALSSGGCMQAEQPYVQYQAALSTVGTKDTPSLGNVTIAYPNFYGPSGTVTSPAFDSGSAATAISELDWTEATSTGTSVKLSLRGASSLAALSSAAWNDFTDMSTGALLTPVGASTTVAISQSAIASLAPSLSSNTNEWWQYMLTATSTGVNAATLSAVTVDYTVTTVDSGGGGGGGGWRRRRGRWWNCRFVWHGQYKSNFNRFRRHCNFDFGRNVYCDHNRDKRTECVDSFAVYSRPDARLRRPLTYLRSSSF